MSLTSTQCRAAKATGRTYRLSDRRHGLMLVVGARGAKSWIQRIRYHGKRHDIGLGSYELVNLKQAREEAIANRKAVLDGQDPRQPQGMSFEAAATVVIRERTAELTDKARHDWNQSLRNHVYPSIGTMPVSDVDSPHIRAILMALAARRATMHNVSNRISRILQWAIVMGHREKMDTARLVLESIPKCCAAKTVSHSAKSLHHSQVKDAIAAVARTGVMASTKRAFEFLCLTACRTGEVLGAQWSEIDIDAATWTVPAGRMKMRQEHKVPLSRQAVAVLKASRDAGKGDLVFAGMNGRNGRLSDKALETRFRAPVSPAPATASEHRSATGAERRTYKRT